MISGICVHWCVVLNLVLTGSVRGKFITNFSLVLFVDLGGAGGGGMYDNMMNANMISAALNMNYAEQVM